jgi:hypothetical protein
MNGTSSRWRKNGERTRVGRNYIDVFDWSGQLISLSLNAGTAVLRLFNSPLGYMDEVMEAELLQVLDSLEQWPDGHVVVLTGCDAGCLYGIAMSRCCISAVRPCLPSARPFRWIGRSGPLAFTGVSSESATAG